MAKDLHIKLVYMILLMIIGYHYLISYHFKPTVLFSLMDMKVILP